MKKMVEKKKYEFTIISDKDGAIAREYNAFGKPVDFDVLKFEIAIPLTFLINMKGEIAWQYLGTKTERTPIDQILEAIDTKL